MERWKVYVAVAGLLGQGAVFFGATGLGFTLLAGYIYDETGRTWLLDAPLYLAAIVAGLGMMLRGARAAERIDRGQTP